jgi:hypothetical protein
MVEDVAEAYGKMEAEAAVGISGLTRRYSDDSMDEKKPLPLASSFFVFSHDNR